MEKIYNGTPHKVSILDVYWDDCNDCDELLVLVIELECPDDDDNIDNWTSSSDDESEAYRRRAYMLTYYRLVELEPPCWDDIRKAAPAMKLPEEEPQDVVVHLAKPRTYYVRGNGWVSYEEFVLEFEFPDEWAD